MTKSQILNENKELTLDWILKTLKTEGRNGKGQVIERLENASIDELNDLNVSIIDKQIEIYDKGMERL